MKKLSFLLALPILFVLSGIAHSEEMPSEMPTKPSLYERLGGEAAIQAVVDDFVARTSANPAVNFTRQGKKRSWEATPENVEKLKKHLVAFVVMATGGPSNYQGRDMKSTHQDLEITHAEFDALAADLKATLEKFNVPAAEQDELMAVAGTTRGAIVEEISEKA
jgi:hemoglobin